MMMARDGAKRDASDPRRLLSGGGAGQMRLQFAVGQTIFKQGDLTDEVFYIEHGQVKLSVVSAGGKEAVVAVHGTGDFFGTRSLLSGDQRIATATALADCTLIRIRKSAMRGLLRENLDLAEMFLCYLLRQHIRDQENIIDQLTNSAERRLARVLLQLAAASHGGRPNTIKLNQTELANMIGTTRSRVSSFMNKFRHRGFIDYDRQGVISVRDGLRKVLNDG